MTVRPRKRFGQHWLRDQAILQRIADVANLQPTDCILEIGPGQGALTHHLLERGGRVIGVEIDRDLCELLHQTFDSHPHFQLLERDILQINLAERLAPGFPPANKVVANIPYNITGPILALLLGRISQPRSPGFDQIVLLVQQEVAQRICAQPGSKVYGALSVRLQYLADCQIVCPVPRRAFEPPPQVDSAVIQLRPRPLAHPAQDPTHLERILQLGFANKRKMLRNNLKSMVDRPALENLLETLGAVPEIRAEGLGLDQWITLSNRLLELQRS